MRNTERKREGEKWIVHELANLDQGTHSIFLNIQETVGSYSPIKLTCKVIYIKGSVAFSNVHTGTAYFGKRKKIKICNSHPFPSFFNEMNEKLAS